MVIAVSMLSLQACRRHANDEGVGTSSVGAGGANADAPNYNAKAEPVKGTDTAQSNAGLVSGETPASNSETADPARQQRDRETTAGGGSAGQPAGASGGTTERAPEIDRSNETRDAGQTAE